MNAGFYFMHDKCGEILVAILDFLDENHCEESIKQF